MTREKVKPVWILRDFFADKSMKEQDTVIIEQIEDCVDITFTEEVFEHCGRDYSVEAIGDYFIIREVSPPL